MAVLYSYENKSGFYLQTRADGLNQTLQVNASAENYFQQLEYRDGDTIPNTLVRPLFAFGDVHTTHREVSKDILSEIPHSGTLSESQSRSLRRYLISRLNDEGTRKEKLETVNTVLQEDTQANPIQWKDKYEIDVSVDTSENPLSTIADQYFDNE